MIVLAALLTNPELLERRPLAVGEQGLQVALVLGGPLVAHQVAAIAVHGALAGATEGLAGILGRPAQPRLEDLQPLLAELLVVLGLQGPERGGPLLLAPFGGLLDGSLHFHPGLLPKTLISVRVRVFSRLGDLPFRIGGVFREAHGCFLKLFFGLLLFFKYYFFGF